ncbi:MAG: hypothetical protein LC725_10820 [Lentisphaerae bacterium]|nr:hypothetical protein [Lentisphaerota bacterium]
MLNSFKSYAALLLAVLALAQPARTGSAPAHPIIGVKLGRLEGEPDTVLRELAAAGFNAVFVQASVCASPDFINYCHQAGLQVHAIFGVFVDAAAIREDPSLSQINALGNPMWAKRKNYRLVCPNRDDYRATKLAAIAEFLKEYPVDGISLDFLRYGVEWEMIPPDATPGPDQEYCFCPTCLALFGRDRNLPPAEVPELARLILTRHSAEWTDFKCRSITSMAQAIRDQARALRPGISITLHALPWTDRDYNDGARRLGGQDFRALAGIIDIFSPMNYHYMLRREVASISRQTEYMTQMGCRVLPCIQAGLIFRKDDGFTPDVFRETLEQARRQPSIGINIYTWRDLHGNPAMRRVWDDFMAENALAHPDPPQ